MASATEAPARAEGLTSHTQNQANGNPLTPWQENALAALRVPFEPEQISTRPEIDCPACQSTGGSCQKHYLIECPACERIITVAHTDIVYVDHAEATDRLLEVDLLWNWEPLANDRNGLPLIDEHGGLWIRLTVAGMTRLGYGIASLSGDAKAVKELIGYAIRNAGMRFGMGLDLWKSSSRRKRDTTRPPGFPEGDSLRLRQLTAWTRSYWGQVDKLRELLKWATDEGWAPSLIPAGPGGAVVALGDVLSNRIAELERPAQADAPAAGPPTPAGPPAATRQWTAPATPAAPEETSQDTGAPAPGEEPDEPAGEPAPDEPHRESSGDPVLDSMVNRVFLHWLKPVLLEQDLTEVKRQDLQDRNVEGPPDWGSPWMRFEALVERRLTELGVPLATESDSETDAPGRAA